MDMHNTFVIWLTVREWKGNLHYQHKEGQLTGQIFHFPNSPEGQALAGLAIIEGWNIVIEMFNEGDSFVPSQRVVETSDVSFAWCANGKAMIATYVKESAG